MTNKRWQDLTDEEFIKGSASYSSKEVYAKSFGLSGASPGFSERVRILGVSFKKKKIFTREEFQRAVENADSIAQVIRNLGKEKHIRAYYPVVKLLSREYEIDLPVFDYTKANTAAIKAWRMSDEEYFARDTNRNGPTTRKRLIQMGWEYKCSEPACVLSESPDLVGEQVVWAGKLMTLQVDHIDGDHHNNEITNLRFLCPNCHAASDTYAGRNTQKVFVKKDPAVVSPPVSRKPRAVRKKRTPKPPPPKNFCECGVEIFRTSKSCRTCEGKNRVGALKTDYPPLDDIIAGIEQQGYSAYGRTLGVSCNAVRKHLRRNGVDPLPQRVLPVKTCADCDVVIHKTSIRCPDCARVMRYGSV